MAKYLSNEQKNKLRETESCWNLPLKRNTVSREKKWFGLGCNAWVLAGSGIVIIIRKAYSKRLGDCSRTNRFPTCLLSVSPKRLASWYHAYIEPPQLCWSKHQWIPSDRCEMGTAKYWYFPSTEIILKKGIKIITKLLVNNGQIISCCFQVDWNKN